MFQHTIIESDSSMSASRCDFVSHICWFTFAAAKLAEVISTKLLTATFFVVFGKYSGNYLFIIKFQ